MQRYRVNYVLLIGLTVGAVVASGAVYGVWAMQMSHNAGVLLERADKAEANGDLADAASHLQNYVGFRPKEDEARIRLVNLYIKIAKDLIEKEEYREFMGVKQRVASALYRFPGESKLRADWVDVLMTPGMVQRSFAKDAANHIKVLLARQPEDAGLLMKYATSLASLGKPREAAAELYKLIGYDNAADTFDTSQAIAPHNIQAYGLLTDLLVGPLERRKVASHLQKQMVQANPESGKAYLAQAKYLFAMDRGKGSMNDWGDEAATSLKKAYELDPKNTGILLTLAQQAQRKKDFDLTKKYLEEGLTLGTDIGVFYGGLARLERAQGNQENAMAQLDKGMAVVEGPAKWMLMFQKAEIQIGTQDIPGAQETIRAIKRLAGRSFPQTEFYEAWILASKKEWIQAARALEKVRPKLLSNAAQRVHADILLGLAYENQGKSDLALRAFKNVLVVDPANTAARAGRLRAEKTTGVATRSDRIDDLDFNGKLNEIFKKPEKDRDWKAFDAYANKYAEVRKLTDVQRDLLKIEVYARRKKFTEAKEMLRGIYKDAGDDMSVWRAAVRLEGLDPEGGPERALAILDRVVERFEDQPQLRLDRADLLVATQEGDVAQSLLQLGEGADGWSDSQKVHLWRGLAKKLERIGKKDEAEQAWQQVAEITPDDLPTLSQLFDLANSRNDDQAMIEVQKKILDVVGGSKEDSTWALTEAARLFSLHRRSLAPEGTSAKILKLIDTALEDRNDWAQPYLLRASLAMFEQRYLDAIEDFRNGLRRGRGNAYAISQYVRLLVAQGNFSDAQEALRPYNAAVRLALLGDIYAHILYRNGDFADAAEAAGKLADAKSSDPIQQLRYGKFMQQIAATPGVTPELAKASLAKAGLAFSTVVEVAPGDPQGWLSWVTYLLLSNDRAGAEQAIREAQLALDEDRQLLLLARCYEIMGRWFDAENLYHLSLEQNPENSKVARQLASFYLSPRYRGAEGKSKATTLLNDLLRRQAKADDSVDRADANWARRVAARLLAGTGDYQNLLQAEKLLASNSLHGTLGVEDKLEMARILATRPEPVSRKKAIILLEEIQQRQPLDSKMSLQLAQLYFHTANWPQCRSQMSSLLTKFPQFASARSAYIRMLVQRGGRTDLEIADKQVDRLLQLAPNSIVTLELASQVYRKQGNDAKARSTIHRVVPQDLSKINETQASHVRHLASILAKLDDLDTAEKLLTALANRPDASVRDKIILAGFIGDRRDAQRGFDLLDDLVADGDLTAIISAGAGIIRANQEEVGNTFDEKIEDWLARAERDDPDSITNALTQADFYDLQKRYGEAAAINRRLLARDELKGRRRAVVLNNLAYLLALGAAPEAKPNEAALLIRETVQLLGPISDLLDTRAVISNGRKEFQAAVEDLQLAVLDKPTASSYFHKTIAHLGLRQRSAALESWEKATELGLTHETINPLERKQFEEVAIKIKALQARNNSL